MSCVASELTDYLLRNTHQLLQTTMLAWANTELARNYHLIATVLYGATLSESGAPLLSSLPAEARFYIAEYLGVHLGAEISYIARCTDVLRALTPGGVGGKGDASRLMFVPNVRL